MSKTANTKFRARIIANAKAKKTGKKNPFVQIFDKGGKKEIHVTIYEEINSSWGYSSKQLQNDLKGLDDGDEVIVHINSPGGSVWEGMAIYNVLKNAKAKVTTIIEGIAASMSSIIALAGSTRKIYDGAMVMIHNPMIDINSANSKEVEGQLDLLQKVEGNVKAIYKSSLTADEKQIDKWLEDETYFTAEEAKEAGFVSEILVPPENAARVNLDKLAAKIRPRPTKKKGSDTMSYKEWLAAECELLELDPDELTETQQVTMQKRYKESKKTKDPSSHKKSRLPDPDDSEDEEEDEDPTDRYDQQIADRFERHSTILDLADEMLDTKLDEEYLKKLRVTGKTMKSLAAHAIRKKWTVDKFELEARRATVTDIGHVGIHSRSSVTETNVKAYSCAVLRATKVPRKAKQIWTGEEYGWEQKFDEETLDASDQIKDVSILQIFDRLHQHVHGYRYEGRLNTDGFFARMRETLHKIRASGNSTWTALDIFDDAANKTLWAAYNAQNTTWQEWVLQQSVPDFKTGNFYRMTLTGGYQKVGPDGMLAHGSFLDDKYTASADTYGKIVGLSRTDLINDDMGAFNSIMTALGVEGAVFLEELFYQHFLSNLTTLFPTDNSKGNYISGATTALSVDGLTQADTAFSNQVVDTRPILVQPSMILVGSTNKVIAQELYTKTSLQVLQSANAKGRPDENPHVGKYRPVMSPYLNNTSIKQRIPKPPGAAISGQSATQWFMLTTPSQGIGGVLIGVFLNGQVTPTIQQADADFNMLGMQWRSFSDAGAGLGDPKLGVHSKGAA